MRIVVIVALIAVGAIAYRAFGMLSSDALGMAIGILLGILAGLPMRILVAAQERQERQNEPQRPQLVENHYYVNVDAQRGAEIPTQAGRCEITQR